MFGTRIGGNPHHQFIMGWIQTPTGNQSGGGGEITDPTSVNLLKTTHNMEHVEVIHTKTGSGGGRYSSTPSRTSNWAWLRFLLSFGLLYPPPTGLFSVLSTPLFQPPNRPNARGRPGRATSQRGGAYLPPVSPGGDVGGAKASTTATNFLFPEAS